MNKPQPDSEVAGQAAEASKLTTIDVTSIFGTVTEPAASTQTTPVPTNASFVSSSPNAGNLSSMLEKVRAQNSAQPSPQPAQTTGASRPAPNAPTAAAPQLTQKYQMPQSAQTASAAPATEAPAAEVSPQSLTRLLDSEAFQALNSPPANVEMPPVASVFEAQLHQPAEGEVAVTQLYEVPHRAAESLARASRAMPHSSEPVVSGRNVDSATSAHAFEAALAPQAAAAKPADSVPNESIPARQTADAGGVQTSGTAPGEGSVTQLLQNLWAPSIRPSSAPSRVAVNKREAPVDESIAKVEERLSPSVGTSKPAYSNTIAKPVTEQGPSRASQAAASAPAPAAPAGEFTRIIQASALRESVVAGRAGQPSQPMEAEPSSSPAPVPVFAPAPHLSIMMVTVIVLQVVIVLLLLLRH